MLKTIYVDMDNTLIDTQLLYDAAHTELADVIQKTGPFKKEDILSVTTANEIALFDTYGYGRQMLPHAFANTLLHYKKDANDAELDAVRAIANDVYRKIAMPKKGAMESITRLSRHFNVCLLTVGDEEVQKKRVDILSCKEAFHEIFVVPVKDVAMYRQILAKTNTLPHQTMMIGDSLKSDIIPAVKAGMQAIFIPAHNWVAREMNGVKLPESGAIQLADIVSAADEICASQLPLPRKANSLIPRAK